MIGRENYFGLPNDQIDKAHERLEETLAGLTSSNIAESIADNTLSFDLPGRDDKFGAFVRRGESDRMLAIFPEFAGQANPDYFAKAMGAAAMFDPDATLVVFRHGGPSLERSPLALSREERKDYGGALAERLKIITEDERSGKPSDLVVSGASLGATPALRYATDLHTPGAAVVLTDPVELPRTPDPRNVVNLYTDLMQGNGDANEAILGSYPDQDAAFPRELREQNTFIRGQARFGGIVLRHPLETLAELRPLRKGTAAGEDMQRMLEGKRTSALVHMWSTHGLVSPLEANRGIAETLSSHPRYASRELDGSGHLEAIMNIPRLGQAAILAHTLRPLQ